MKMWGSHMLDAGGWGIQSTVLGRGEPVSAVEGAVGLVSLCVTFDRSATYAVAHAGWGCPPNLLPACLNVRLNPHSGVGKQRSSRWNQSICNQKADQFVGTLPHPKAGWEQGPTAVYMQKRSAGSL